MPNPKNNAIKSPFHPSVIQARPERSGIAASIEEIQAEIEQLEALGIPPDGAWINICKVQGKEFKQARWKSREPCFASNSNPEAKLRSQYIGKENSPEHQAAIAMVKRRQRIRTLKQQLGKTNV